MKREFFVPEVKNNGGWKPKNDKRGVKIAIGDLVVHTNSGAFGIVVGFTPQKVRVSEYRQRYKRDLQTRKYEPTGPECQANGFSSHWPDKLLIIQGIPVKED